MRSPDCPNRALLDDRIEQALQRARRTMDAFALMVIDLDGFKEVNDIRGHDAGDQVLQSIARRLETVVRASDTVARVGGDEFVVLSSDAGRRGGGGSGRSPSPGAAPALPRRRRHRRDRRLGRLGAFPRRRRHARGAARARRRPDVRDQARLERQTRRPRGAASLDAGHRAGVRVGALRRTRSSSTTSRCSTSARAPSARRGARAAPAPVRARPARSGGVRLPCRADPLD